MEILQAHELDSIQVVSVAKGEKRNDGTENFYMADRVIPIPFKTELHFFMERLRDEAHRFAITTHRKKRKKSTFQNSLDGIEGIGKKRKDLLLQVFGSSVAVSKANIEDLKKIKGISHAIAVKIYNYYNES